MWRGHAPGLLEVQRQLHRLSKITKNECFAIYLLTQEIVGRVNVRTAEGKIPVLFQITYDENLSRARAEVLRLQGYEVVSAFGNDAAKIVLGTPEHYDLFIVGHAAPEETRRAMVEWLREKHPGVRILALNPPSVHHLLGADYNLKLNGPETLLPVIATALGGSDLGRTSIASF